MKSFFVSCPACHHNFEPIEAQSKFIANEVETALVKEKMQLNQKQKELFEKESSLKIYENEIDAKVEETLKIKLSEVENKAQYELAKKFELKLKDLENQLNEKGMELQKSNEFQLQAARQLREANERQQKLDFEVEQRVDSIMKVKLTEAKDKVKLDESRKYEIKIQDIENQLKEREVAIRASAEQQLLLTKQLREANERQQKMDLEIEQKVLEKLDAVKSDAQIKAEELYKYQIAQKDKQLKDMGLQLETARRTAEQGSQQAQGEIVELEFEKILTAKYPSDQFVPVRKGFDGADLMQTVVNATGKKVGSIIWEFKNTKNFSYDWLVKLKNDQQQAKADVAILVTKTLPKDSQAIEMIDGVLVVSFSFAIPVSIIIRKSLDDLSYAHLLVQGQDEKMRRIYSYLTGTQFKIKIKAIISAFQSLKDEIETEKRAFKKIWSMREKMLEQIIDSTSSMYGDIAGIAGSVIPKIEELEIPEFTLLGEKSESLFLEK